MKATPSSMLSSSTNAFPDGPIINDPVLSAADSAGQAPDPMLVEDPAIEPTTESNPDSWRLEVAARLERYRTRRKPRTPRYPSLLLPFDAPESWSRPSPQRAAQNSASPIAEETAVLESPGFAEAYSRPEQIADSPVEAPQESAKVLEFPRSAAIPIFHASTLADPIFDRPRIVEAPEILPPPPALGGILIEPVQRETPDRRAGTDYPSDSFPASLPRRALAALVDASILAASLAAFAAIFLWMNPGRSPIPILAAAFAVVLVLLWTIYEFLFIVYTGSTPGSRAAGLRLVRFDGSPLSRRARRWRVLASFLSAFSAGLGYIWCFMDQDGLCWHDRITRTHLQSIPETK